MRPIQIVILLIAFGAAGAAGVLALRLMRAPEPVARVAESAPEPKEAEVLVAAADLKLGTMVTSDSLAWAPWPLERMHPGFITREAQPEAIAAFESALVRQPVFAGEPIREERLAREKDGFLSLMLPKGMRAVGVRVNTAATAGGFILPNDHVDVILIPSNRGGVGEMRAQTILTNIRVLAIDQAIEAPGDQKTAALVAKDTVTLELSPSQAERLVEAAESGSIALSLRAAGDDAPLAVARMLPLPPMTAKKAPPQATKVKIIRFGFPSHVSVRSDP